MSGRLGGRVEWVGPRFGEVCALVFVFFSFPQSLGQLLVHKENAKASEKCRKTEKEIKHTELRPHS